MPPDVSHIDVKLDGPPFLLVEHKLGVTFWSVPYVLKYAQKVFAAEKKHLDSFGRRLQRIPGLCS